MREFILNSSLFYKDVSKITGVNQRYSSDPSILVWATLRCSCPKTEERSETRKKRRNSYVDGTKINKEQNGAWFLSALTKFGQRYQLQPNNGPSVFLTVKLVCSWMHVRLLDLNTEKVCLSPYIEMLLETIQTWRWWQQNYDRWLSRWW